MKTDVRIQLPLVPTQNSTARVHVKSIRTGQTGHGKVRKPLSLLTNFNENSQHIHEVKFFNEKKKTVVVKGVSTSDDKNKLKPWQ